METFNLYHLAFNSQCVADSKWSELFLFLNAHACICTRQHFMILPYLTGHWHPVRPADKGYKITLIPVTYFSAAFYWDWYISVRMRRGNLKF
jgi:hypothetical protein